MITADRAVESLVEKFAIMCSQDYSLKTDRSDQIIDYVMGRTEKFPDMMGKSSHYVYQTIDVLMKLAKKDSGDVFFRAGAIVIYLESNFSRRSSWGSSGFSVCLGDDGEAYGLSGKSKSNDRMGALLSRLEQINRFAGEKEIVGELKSRLNRVQWLLDSKKADSQGNFRDVINAMLLLRLYSDLNGDSSHAAQVQLFTQNLPELLQLVMANNAGQLRQVLHTLIEPLVVCSIQTRANKSALELNQEFIQQKRNQLIADQYPNTSLNKKDQLSPIVFHQTMVLLSSALLYMINISGGKERFLESKSETGRVLLEAITQLHEIYPFEIRLYLLSMDPRAKSANNLLTGLLPLDEPYQLIEVLRNELNMYTVSWQILQSAITNQPDQARRAYELLKPPFLKLCIQKVMEENGLEMPNAEGTVEQAVFTALRQPIDGGRNGLAIARYLEGETSFEDFWKEQNNRGLFNAINRDRKRIMTLIAISFLPVESEAMRRFAILLTRPECGTLEIVSDMYSSYAFSGEKLLKQYGEDPEVNREELLSSLLSLNGMTDYRYKSMPQDEYRRIIGQNLDYALRQYKKLPTDTRILILETAFERRDELTTEQMSIALRSGLQDTSKKANALALAEFNRIPDKSLYMSIYRTEKKAGIKEMVLNAIRSLDDSKDVYGELLKVEKSADWKNLIQILLDTADLSPAHAHAALAEQADAKKTARLGWLSIKDLPTLMSIEGQPLDDRIKQYVLLQSLDHTSAPNESLNELRMYATEESLVRFATELLQLWIQEGAPAKEKWVMYLSGLYGDLQVVHILAPQIKEWTENSRGAIAADAVKVLAFLKEPAALMAIDTIKRSVKNRQVKGAAEEALQLAADNMGLTPEQLEDRLVTTLGFDERGTQRLSYGERSFLIKVNRDLQVVVLNEETGKAVKSLPAPAQKDDADLAAKSKSRFTQLKKDLKSMVNIQSQRLEESLSKQRLWSADEWKALFVNNVIMQKFAVGLIWGIYEDGELMTTFRYMEDGTFNTVDEDEYELASGSLVGLIHPLELDQSTLEGWKTQLEDYEIKQPFEQLNREIHVPEDEDKNKDEYDRLPESDFSPTAFPKALEKYGWIKGAAQDGGWYHEFYKEYGDLVAELSFSGTSITYYEGLEEITLESLHFFRPDSKKHYYYGNNKSITLGQIPGRVFSETIYDILRATGR